MSPCRIALVPLLLAAWSFAACDDKPEAPAKKTDGEKTDVEKTDGEKTAESKGDDVFTLGAVKVFEEGKPADGVTLTADGEVSRGGKKIGTLVAAGTLTLDDGNRMFSAKADGRMFDGAHESGIELTESGIKVEIEDSRYVLTFEDDGTVAVDPAPTFEVQNVRHEGCTGALRKTCAFLHYAVLPSGPLTKEPSDGSAKDAVPSAESAAKPE